MQPTSDRYRFVFQGYRHIPAEDMAHALLRSTSVCQWLNTYQHTSGTILHKFKVKL